MGHDQARLIDQHPAMGDQIQIERARGVGGSPLAAECLLESEQRVHRLARRQPGFDKGNAVEIDGV